MAATRLKSEARGIAELLGVDDVLGRKSWHVKDMQDLLRKGFPYMAFEKIVHLIEIRPGDLATIVGVAPRTLARRKSRRQLSPIESDRLYRVARITFKASETLGSLD